MSKWDVEYIKLCKKILKDGKRVENRTGIDSIKIPSYHLHFDLSEEFPVLTTKRLYFRQAILEMLWIYQAQSNDVRWLQERNVHIWDEWQIAEDGKWRANQNVLENGKLVKKDIEKEGVEWMRLFSKNFIKKSFFNMRYFFSTNISKLFKYFFLFSR